VIARHFTGGERVADGDRGASLTPTDLGEIGRFSHGSVRLAGQAAATASDEFLNLDWSSNRRLDIVTLNLSVRLMLAQVFWSVAL